MLDNMEIIITMAITSLLWLLVAARIIWRVKQDKDPITAIIPTAIVAGAKRLPNIIIRAEQTTRRESYKDNA